ncbi:condensin complex subunit 3 [Thrips palmi]|uniref:Condensin complex subunit 3 n=1 Tax=Thrips palmi TaxID=161013 RepID=A0A6P8ZI94_THRPL|nr:condensin complex subunit 3 [Thrips palmi]
MSEATKKSFRDAFQKSQYSVTSHEKLFRHLKQLYAKMPADVFLAEFIRCLQVALIHGEKHRTVENSLNFAAKFIALLLPTKPLDDGGKMMDVEEEEEICPFVLNVLKFLFENHNSEHQGIRFRVCQFINKILNSLGNDACLDDNLCDDISECMMERLQDKAPAVRMQAVLALHRLQDPADANCPVMKAFLFHMSSDPNADVRRAVITNLAITSQSVRCLLERTHDCKDVVRRAAYVSLSKLGVARFSIIQRVKLLTNGLKDHSALVRESVSKVMLPSWLQFYKGSFLALIHALDCENSTEISILTLQSLFKSESIKSVLEELTKLLNEDKVIPVGSLNPDNALYWRVLVEYLEAHPEIAEERPVDEPLPELLPELSTFCNYIKEYYEVQSAKDEEHWVKLQHHYVLTQLLQLCKSFDLADEMGRSNLKSLCLYLLTNNTVSENIVPVVIELMVKILPSVEDRLQALAEVISEVREPMIEQGVETAIVAVPTLSNEELRQRDLKQLSIRVKINELKEEQDDAVRNQDFVKAQALQEDYKKLQLELEALMEAPAPAVVVPPPQVEVRDAVKDEMALRKCLRIVREMVQSDTVKTLSATLRSLMQNFVVPCLQEDNSNVIRNKALECLGIFCLLDKPLAQENFLMFCFQIANDDVCEVALKVTFDLLLLYGLETFQIQEENGETTEKKKSKKKKNLFVTDMYDDGFDTEEEESQETQTHISSGSSGNTSNLISILTSLLDSTSTSMRNLAMEGLYKLLMACRITSSALLTRLILMWYSPVTEGDETLRQPLGVFLTVYASQCPRSQETLEQAFLPTLKTLINAPVTSPLTQIDLDSVARLFVSLTRPGTNKNHSKTSHIHNNMALSICNAIMDSDNATCISVLLRALNCLDLCLDDPVYREELKTLTFKVREIFRSSKEKQFVRSLDKIISAVQAAMENVSMRTNEVDNTAASSQLEGTNTLIDKTINSDVQEAEKRSNNARLLHPRMHSILAENEFNEEEEEEDDNSQKTPTATSGLVIPPSPPRSLPSDSEEEENSSNSKTQKNPVNSTTNDTFKKPAKPSKTRTREQIRATSSSDADNSPVPKRRKAASKDEETESSTAKRPMRGAAEKNAEEVPKPVKARSTTLAQEQKSTPVSVKRNVKGVSKNDTERRSSPKRQINPTEKGATLKTFQNISAVSPSRTPPAKRVKKAANVSILTTETEIDISTDVQPSETSSAGTSKMSPRSRPSTRRSMSLPDRNSVDSPPASAAELQRNKTKKVDKISSKRVSEEGNDSDKPSPTRGRRLKQGPKQDQGKSVAPVALNSEADSDCSPVPKRVRQLTQKSKTVQGNMKSKSPNDASKSSSDVSPALSTRSGRSGRVQESPSCGAKSSQSENTTTDSDSSPLPASKQKRARSKSAASSPKVVVLMKELTPSSLGSGKVPQVKGIVPLRNTRRSISQSETSGGLSDQSSPNVRSTRRSTVRSEDESQSPLSAASLKERPKKNSKASVSKRPVELASSSDESPARRSLRGSAEKVLNPKGSAATKTTRAVMSPSSESPASISPQPAFKVGHTNRKTVQSDSPASVQQSKKIRKKTSDIESPMSDSPGRFLRSQVETPSPRTRSGKF